ncbi:MAG: TlpA family protein disulfide reductase, partial [Chitinophagaceae bacterium]
AEFPDLNKLKAKFGDQVNFVSVTFDKSLKVQEFLKKKPLDFITVTDATDITDGIGLTSYPTTIFLDKDGRVASVQNNMSEGDKPQPEHPGKESFESILKKLL